MPDALPNLFPFTLPAPAPPNVHVWISPSERFGLAVYGECEREGRPLPLYHPDPPERARRIRLARAGCVEARDGCLRLTERGWRAVAAYDPEHLICGLRAAGDR